jgi:hypothetical protein
MTAINEHSSNNTFLTPQNCFIEQPWGNLESKGLPYIGMVNLQDSDKKQKNSEVDYLTQTNTAREANSSTDTENHGKF